MANSLKEEGHRFLSSTSMKGVARAVSSERLSLRGLWTVAVFGLLGFTTYQVYSLLASFLEYAVVTSVNERNVHPTKFVVPLPILTICSQNPIPASQTLPPGVPTLQDYFSMVDHKMTCGDNCTEKEEQTYARVRSILKTPNAYFQNVGVENARLIGHKKENFIADCNLIILAGTEIYPFPCEGSTNITQRLIKDFFNCFEVASTRQFMPDFGVLLGIEMVLYLDSPADGGGRSFSTGHMASGAVVMPTNLGASDVYMMEVDGSYIPSGNDVRIKVHTMIRERESAPYGDCSKYSSEGDRSRAACLGRCLDTHVQETCLCAEPITPVTSNPDQPFCLSLKPNKSQVKTNVQCRVHAIIGSFAPCLDRCTPECVQNQYRVEIQSSTWPSSSHLSTFYQKIIHNKPYSAAFSDLKSLIQGNFSSDLDYEDKLAHTMRHIHGNFSRLSMHLTDQQVFVMKDIKKISISELLSQLGGALNLWSGITVVLILEILEFGYRVVCRLLFTSDIQTKPSMETENKDKSGPTLHKNGKCSRCKSAESA